jgi:hypothetical protein
MNAWMSTQIKKISSNLLVVRVGYISFQEISYPGKPQVVSRYILSNLWLEDRERERMFFWLKWVLD